jgi:hypothetical protein
MGNISEMIVMIRHILVIDSRTVLRTMLIAAAPAADVLIALEIAVSGEYVPEADIDENGCVNALDARMIMQAAAGRIKL